MISTDTSLMHAADACGVRTIALWGPAPWFKNRPANGHVTPVFGDEKTAPTERTRSIAVEAVGAAVESLLS
ncbi:MAG: hypothetical protein M5R36_26425 [Deltaproteobacteria bacterium]|nr:hypothetical protein [Deltaproteobacteria bacterium]